MYMELAVWLATKAVEMACNGDISGELVMKIVEELAQDGAISKISGTRQRLCSKGHPTRHGNLLKCIHSALSVCSACFAQP